MQRPQTTTRSIKQQVEQLLEQQERAEEQYRNDRFQWFREHRVADEQRSRARQIRLDELISHVGEFIQHGNNNSIILLLRRLYALQTWERTQETNRKIHEADYSTLTVRQQRDQQQYNQQILTSICAASNAEASQQRQPRRATAAAVSRPPPPPYTPQS